MARETMNATPIKETDVPVRPERNALPHADFWVRLNTDVEELKHERGIKAGASIAISSRRKPKAGNVVLFGPKENLSLGIFGETDSRSVLGVGVYIALQYENNA